MSADRISDVRYLGGWNVDGQDSGCDISGWNEGEFPSGWNEGEFLSGWNERCHKLRTLKNYGNLCICLTPRKPDLHSLYQVPTFLEMLMVSISENTKVKKGKKRRYRST